MNIGQSISSASTSFGSCSDGREFDGCIAVVTGASSGIGRAIALALARRGAIIYAIGRNANAVKAIGEHLDAANPVRAYHADLTTMDRFTELANRVETEFGGLDLLIHAAAFVSMGSLQTAGITDFDLHYRVNVRAPYLLTQTFLPLLKQRSGQVVFINSSVGLRAERAELGQYSATKHALKAVADSLRDEVNHDGMRVLSVYPGRTATPGQEAIHKKEGKPYHPELLLQPEDVASVILHSVLLPRTAEVTDISIRPMRKP
ncbi:MAG TPA: SDR family NAD(P)-dependent oxidoreductase [Bryobacteraceae bacterium]|nr:SDR family NAD(P)-dependent oxidoreductase [Bryobacteraceae bacterium]